MLRYEWNQSILCYFAYYSKNNMSDINVKIGVVLADENKRILLVKEKLPNKDRPLWNGVKGSYGDNGDEPIFDAAVRECREEVGAEVELTRALGAYISSRDEKIRIQFNFLATIKSGGPKLADRKEQETRGEDIRELRWFTADEIESIPPEEFMSNRIYELIRDWQKGNAFPLTVYKNVDM